MGLCDWCMADKIVKLVHIYYDDGNIYKFSLCSSCITEAKNDPNVTKVVIV